MEYSKGERITIIGSIITILGCFMPWVTIWIFSFSIFDIVSLKYGITFQEFGPYITYFLFFLFSALLLLISSRLIPVSDPLRYSRVFLALSFIFWSIIFIFTILGILDLIYQPSGTYSLPVSIGSGEATTFIGLIVSFIGIREWKKYELKEESEKGEETIIYLNEISKDEQK